MMLMMSGYTMGFFFPRQVEAVDQAPKILKERDAPPERPTIDIGGGDAADRGDSQRDDFPSSMLFYRYF